MTHSSGRGEESAAAEAALRRVMRVAHGGDVHLEKGTIMLGQLDDRTVSNGTWQF